MHAIAAFVCLKPLGISAVVSGDCRSAILLKLTQASSKPLNSSIRAENIRAENILARVLWSKTLDRLAAGLQRSSRTSGYLRQTLRQTLRTTLIASSRMKIGFRYFRIGSSDAHSRLNSRPSFLWNSLTTAPSRLEVYFKISLVSSKLFRVSRSVCFKGRFSKMFKWSFWNTQNCFGNDGCESIRRLFRVREREILKLWLL